MHCIFISGFDQKQTHSKAADFVKMFCSAWLRILLQRRNRNEKAYICALTYLGLPAGTKVKSQDRKDMCTFSDDAMLRPENNVNLKFQTFTCRHLY